MNNKKFEKARDEVADNIQHEIEKLDDPTEKFYRPVGSWRDNFNEGADWAYNYRQVEIDLLENESNRFRNIIENQIFKIDLLKTQFKIARDALDWYASRTIYEKLNQFPGDDTYTECKDIAEDALNTLTSMEKTE